MLGLNLDAPHDRPFRLLCLGAHSDDIEIGCGGTILRILEERPGTDVRWVVLGASGDRGLEARHGASLFLADSGSHDIQLRGFRDGFFPYVAGDIKEFFESLKTAWTPDLVLTHYREDRHQDHRVVSDLTWNTFRNHLVLEYEIPKYDGDLGTPNFYVQLRADIARRKISNIMESFRSQHGRGWFTEDTFYAILRLRGVECNSEHKLAEAFYSRKARM